MTDVLNQAFQFLWDSFFKDGIMIILVANVIGYIVKKYVKQIPNDLIPFICALVGVVTAIFLPQMYIGDALVTRALKGFMLGLAATGAFEMIRNLIKFKLKRIMSSDDTGTDI